MVFWVEFSWKLQIYFVFNKNARKKNLQNTLYEIPQFQLVSWCKSFVGSDSFRTRKLGKISEFLFYVEILAIHKWLHVNICKNPIFAENTDWKVAK